MLSSSPGLIGFTSDVHVRRFYWFTIYSDFHSPAVRYCVLGFGLGCGGQFDTVVMFLAVRAIHCQVPDGSSCLLRFPPHPPVSFFLLITAHNLSVMAE